MQTELLRARSGRQRRRAATRGASGTPAGQRARQWIAGIAGQVVAFAALALAACTGLPGQPDPAARPIRPADVKDVNVLYAGNCAGCHGAEGKLGAARPLADGLYWHVVRDADVRDVVTRGIEGTEMPAFAMSEGGALTDTQIDLLVTGLRARWQGTPLANRGLPAWSVGSAPAGDLGATQRGAAVFAARCALCHGAAGEGGLAPGSLVDPSYLALVSDQALRSAVIFGRTDLGMPDYRGGRGETPLTNGEISDVVAWLGSHRVASPRWPATPQRANPAREEKP